MRLRFSLVLTSSLVVGAGLTAPRTAAAAACDSNLLIVLDRSCSMDNSPGGGETRSKWELAVEAIGTLTTTYAGQLRFGLAMFPDEAGDSCKQDGSIYVPVGKDSEAMVTGTLAATQPDGPCVTNIDTGMAQVSQEPAFSGTPDPEGRRGFVLLISDGKQSGSCGGSARDAVTEQTIKALYDKGYATYVVGFGGAVDPDSLNLFALAGGVPRAGATKYYQADSADDLAMALDAIAGAIVGDPEFGGCPGAPCPDGRCLTPGAVCTDNVCVEPVVDAGPIGGGDADAGADGGAGLGDDPGAADDGGCGCRVDGGATPGGALVGLVVVALLATRRRRR